MERETTCCLTGHRKLPQGAARHVISRVTDGAMYLIDRGYTDFILGGALGFDTLAARALICMKVSGYDLKLHLFLPCPNQDAAWSQYDRMEYRDLLEQADSFRYCSERYYTGCMAARNKAILPKALQEYLAGR